MTALARSWIGLVVALLLQVGTASAQDRGQAGDFDLYVLALSWSKGFCASNPQASASLQCSGEALPGILVHGLWPQYERGYPLRCESRSERPDAEEIGSAEEVMPSEGLARHEWFQHGTCSGLTPSRYFAAIADLHARYAEPLSRVLSGDRITTATLKARITALAHLPSPDAIQLVCHGGRGAALLEDIRICLTRDLLGSRACPAEMQRQDCRASQLVLDPG